MPDAGTGMLIVQRSCDTIPGLVAATLCVNVQRCRKPPFAGQLAGIPETCCRGPAAHRPSAVNHHRACVNSQHESLPASSPCCVGGRGPLGRRGSARCGRVPLNQQAEAVRTELRRSEGRRSGSKVAKPCSRRAASGPACHGGIANGSKRFSSCGSVRTASQASRVSVPTSGTRSSSPSQRSRFRNSPRAVRGAPAPPPPGRGRSTTVPCTAGRAAPHRAAKLPPGAGGGA